MQVRRTSEWAVRARRASAWLSACWIGLLGWSCVVHAQSTPLRFHLLADLDGGGENCHIERGARRWSGLDVRWEAESDRSRIFVVRRFLCRAGSWHLQSERPVDEPVALGTRFDDEDVVRWSIDAGSLATALPRTVHVFAEEPSNGALDVLGEAGWALPEDALRGPAPEDIPATHPGALFVIALVLALCGAVALRWHRTAGRSALAWCGLGGACASALLAAALHAGPAAADADGTPDEWMRADEAHDLLDNEPAVDLIRVVLSESDTSIDIAMHVFDLQAGPLGSSARVLMLGNSLTYSNDLPGMLRAMAAQAGKSLQVQSVTVGGASLEDLFLDGRALREIETGSYDVVVMQQGPSSLPESQIYLRDWTETFAEPIRASGAKPALYMVWPDASRAAFFEAVRQSYRNAATAVDGMFLPAGETWRAAWRERPSLPLYDSDDFHPSRLGTYAAAATIFASLYRESPEGLPPTLQVGGGTIRLDAQEVAIVQRAAWQTHRAHGLAGR